MAGMSASKEFVGHVRELLSSIGELSGGKFFGGHALKHGGLQFAMIMGHTLYLRVNDETRPEYAREALLLWTRKAIHAAAGRESHADA